MDDRERTRLQLTSEVAKLLKNRSLRDLLPPLLSDGTIPFVVALPDDTLREVWARVAVLGEGSHVIVPSELEASGPFRIQILRFSTTGVHKDIGDLDESTECPVNENATVSTLMDHIQVGQALTYYTFDAETVVRFINDSVQPIPA